MPVTIDFSNQELVGLRTVCDPPSLPQVWRSFFAERLATKSSAAAALLSFTWQQYEAAVSDLQHGAAWHEVESVHCEAERNPDCTHQSSQYVNSP